MSTFTNISRDDLYVPLAGRTVPAGADFTVDDEFDSAFAEQPNFATAKKSKNPPAEVPAPSEGDN